MERKDLVPSTLNITQAPDWIYGAMTFNTPQVAIIYIEEENENEEFYDIEYEQIEEKTGGGSRVVARCYL